MLDIQKGISSLLAKAKENPRKPIEDSGKYNELHETAVRSMMSQIAFYKETGSLFDPTGRYLCDDCCMREEPKACSTVSGTISMSTGSCMIWMVGEPLHLEVGQKLTQIEANYGERPEAKGFGCFPRCGWASQAKKQDSAGRPVWCSYWGVHVAPNACCIAESGKDLKVAPGEKK